MARHVIVLEEGLPYSPPNWSGPDLLSPDALAKGDAAAWSRLNATVAAGKNGGTGGPSLDFFLWFSDDEVLGRPDPVSLGRLLDQARENSCGGKLFLVVRKDLDSAKLAAADGQDLRELWMRTAHARRVVDLLQIETNLVEPKTIEGELQEAAAETAKRYSEVLRHLSLDGGWYCWLDPEEISLRKVLSTWRLDYPLEQPSNLVIVVNQLQFAQQRAEVEKALARFPKDQGWRHLVTVLKPVQDEPRDLKDLCREERLGGPVRLQGALQLWYLLLGLNEWRRE